jgi:hypothetical protein
MALSDTLDELHASAGTRAVPMSLLLWENGGGLGLPPAFTGCGLTAEWALAPV